LLNALSFCCTRTSCTPTQFYVGCLRHALPSRPLFYSTMPSAVLSLSPTLFLRLGACGRTLGRRRRDVPLPASCRFLRAVPWRLFLLPSTTSPTTTVTPGTFAVRQTFLRYVSGRAGRSIPATVLPVVSVDLCLLCTLPFRWVTSLLYAPARVAVALAPGACL
jgi:hypothetical protein